MKLQLSLVVTVLAVVASTSGGFSRFPVNSWTPVNSPWGNQRNVPFHQPASPWRQQRAYAAMSRASLYTPPSTLRRSTFVVTAGPPAVSSALTLHPDLVHAVVLTGNSLGATSLPLANKSLPDHSPPKILSSTERPNGKPNDIIPKDVIVDTPVIPKQLANYVSSPNTTRESEREEVASEADDLVMTPPLIPQFPQFPQFPGVFGSLPPNFPPISHPVDGGLLPTFPNLHHYPHANAPAPFPSFSGLDLSPRFSLLGVHAGRLPPTVIRITNHYALKVPVPHPYPVDRPVPYPVSQLVPVKVDVPYLVRVEKPYPVVVDRPFPFPVHHAVPVPVKHPVPILVPQPVPIEVSKPVAVPYPVPQPYPVIENRPVEVPVDRPFPVPVPQAYPVPVEVPKHIGVPYPVDRPVATVVDRPYPVPVVNPTPVVHPHPVHIEDRQVAYPVPVAYPTPVVQPHPVHLEVPKHVTVPYHVDRPVVSPVYKPYLDPVPHPDVIPVEVLDPGVNEVAITHDTKPIVVNEFYEDLKHGDADYDYKD